MYNLLFSGKVCPHLMRASMFSTEHNSITPVILFYVFISEINVEIKLSFLSVILTNEINSMVLFFGYRAGIDYKYSQGTAILHSV